MIQIQGKTYELVKEYKDGWNPEAFRSRFSEVLDRYDYIVGDWGYNQLRLKGFFKEGNGKAKEPNISVFQDYINEYCNFGCAYFVLHKVEDAKRKERGDKENGDRSRPLERNRGNRKAEKREQVEDELA